MPSSPLSLRPLMERHNVNATDAALLAALLRCARTAYPVPSPCVLIAADQRFLRATEAEGLPPLDPQSVPAADVAAFLTGL